MTHTCQREGCTREAIGVVALQLFPPETVMQHYRTRAPLTSVVLDLNVCQQHADEVKPQDLLGDRLEPIAAAVQQHSGFVVDVSGTRLAVLPFTHPDVLRVRARPVMLDEGGRAA